MRSSVAATLLVFGGGGVGGVLLVRRRAANALARHTQHTHTHARRPQTKNSHVQRAAVDPELALHLVGPQLVVVVIGACGVCAWVGSAANRARTTLPLHTHYPLSSPSHPLTSGSTSKELRTIAASPGDANGTLPTLGPDGGGVWCVW